MKQQCKNDHDHHQYLATFKQPKYLLPYLIHLLGGSDRTFHLVDKALMGDLWSIYRIAKCMGSDLKATVRLLTSIEMTVAAATSCLVTRPCHFHYVEDFINVLLRREWTETDLIELANGRYVQNVRAGEKPNRNPLLTVATRMSESGFLGFYKALHELNYRYFKSLGSVEYEQVLHKTGRISPEPPQLFSSSRCSIHELTSVLFVVKLTWTSWRVYEFVNFPHEICFWLLRAGFHSYLAQISLITDKAFEFKLENKFHGKSPFLNGSDKGAKLMNVLKDVIFDTASMMLRYLDTEKAKSLRSRQGSGLCNAPGAVSN
ncbi:unnamed protein product [Taenia asiatica]|uniref:THO complex subunit 2 n=1 Tax=Taenia asiatica TaxID=60517 RepID=A0A158R6W8_TAEAS|nr:unnamed protein product [Taenia asiatica]